MKRNIDQIVEQGLGSEPEFQLRKDFSELVIRRLRKLEAANLRKLYFWIALGTLMIFGFGIALIAYLLPNVWTKLIQFDGFDQAVPAAVLIGIAIGIIQYLDKILVKDKMMRMH